MTLFAELKRRNVIRVALFYIVAAWLLVQVAETVLPLFDARRGVARPDRAAGAGAGAGAGIVVGL